MDDYYPSHDRRRQDIDTEYKRRITDLEACPNNSCGDAHGKVVQRIADNEKKLRQQCFDFKDSEKTIVKQLQDIDNIARSKVGQQECGDHMQMLQDRMHDKVAHKNFTWVVGVMATIYVGTLGFIWAYTNDELNQYMHNVDKSNQTVITVMSDVDTRLQTSIKEFSIRQEKYNDKIDRKIDGIEDRMARIETDVKNISKDMQ